MPGATYALFRRAILGEQQVVCLYDGRIRELCPHIIGTNRRKLRPATAMAMPEARQCQKRPHARGRLA